MNKNKEIELKQRVMLLTNQKQYQSAKKVALKLTKACPKDIEAWYALAQLQEQLGEFEAAVRSYYQVCQTSSPVYAAAIERSVILCWKYGYFQLGIAPAQELVKLKPDKAVSHFYLGFFWFNLNHYLKAETPLLKALEFDQNNIQYLYLFALLYSYIGQSKKSLFYFQKCLEIDPAHPSAKQNILLGYNYLGDADEREVSDAHKYFASKIESSCVEITSFPWLKNERPTRLKVAFISPDLRVHSVAYFFQAILESFSVDKFEVYCYSDTDIPDFVSEKFQELSSVWCESQALTDDKLHQRIIEDQIHILVDLAAYSGGNRVGVFAKRAAPVQVSYLGYPNTTGLSRMDYRITDEWADPVGLTESWHTEKLKRLKNGFLCFSIFETGPNITSLPAKHREDKGICFGSFNSYMKITDHQLALWADILQRIPHSRLYLKAMPFIDDLMQERVWVFFEQKGISRERILLIGRIASKQSHLEQYSEVDIHLDSFPYNGTTTTCEALWQGVPTITLAGSVHRSRVGLSINKQVGLDDFIAENEQDYINIAVQKASDLNSLELLRQGMRERMTHSLLMNKALFIEDIECSFEEMWEERIHVMCGDF